MGHHKAMTDCEACGAFRVGNGANRTRPALLWRSAPRKSWAGQSRPDASRGLRPADADGFRSVKQAGEVRHSGGHLVEPAFHAQGASGSDSDTVHAADAPTTGALQLTLCAGHWIVFL
jgi:hypothetical protein